MIGLTVVITQVQGVRRKQLMVGCVVAVKCVQGTYGAAAELGDTRTVLPSKIKRQIIPYFSYFFRVGPLDNLSALIRARQRFSLLSLASFLNPPPPLPF